MSTAKELLRMGTVRLKEAHIPEWEWDAWLLLEHVTGMTRSRYLCDPQTEISSAAQRLYEQMIGKRSGHIPLQQLTGSQEFMGLSFRIDENVLIPRQDTEILVEEALKYLHGGMEILDLCTGSGCILFSLLKLCPGLSGTGTDLSEKALRVAEENRELLQVDARLIQSDLFEHVDGAFDMIVSNPPYIPTEVCGTLMEEVRDHEPRMALDGHADGLYFFRKIIGRAPEFLKAGGMLLFEIGCDQAEAVEKMMGQAFTDIHVVKDLAGLDRVIFVKMIREA